MRRGRRYRLGAGAWNREEDMETVEMFKRAGVHRGAMLGGEQAHIGQKEEAPASMKGESCLQCLNSHLHALHRNLREQRKNIQGQFISRRMFKHGAVCRWGISSHPLSWPPATA